MCTNEVRFQYDPQMSKSPVKSDTKADAHIRMRELEEELGFQHSSTPETRDPVKFSPAATPVLVKPKRQYEKKMLLAKVIE
uniref:Uncharacterized protein n=1 Tax=Ditylenchus dipsaci TaxID=166011 RepID=A0A915DIB2_9BILA